MKVAVAVAVALSALVLIAPAAGARVVNAETVLPPGQSGFVPQSGENPRLNDQVALFESFRFKPGLFQRGDGAAVPGSTRSARVFRDAFGVPTVSADNDPDLWFGVGYAIAQDRMVQMELYRRGARGTLAAVLGRDRLESDIVARRDYYTATELRAMVRRVPTALRARIEAYTDGINAYLTQLRANPAENPREFQLLNLNPEPWTAVDTAAIGVQLARTVPSSDGSEIANARALKSLGATRFDQLLPLRKQGQVATVPRANGLFPSLPGRTRAEERAAYKRSQRFLRGLSLPRAQASATRMLRGGSKHWAIRGQNGAAFLFSGPQLGFSIPEQLVEVEVHRPGLDARGTTVPGVPIVGIGRNEHLAWGVTSSLTDDDDLYVERLAGSERYRYRGRTRRMTCRNETFQVSGAAARKERICRTVHGPVQARAGGRAFARRYAIWGHELDTFEGLSELNEAATVQAAERALRKVSWTENTLVADDRGNIGWFLPGTLPLRDERWDERLPLPGTGEAEWKRLLRWREHPQVINPAQGWLANWNNLPSEGWTSGDSEATEQITGRLHRGAYLADRVSAAAAAPSYDALKSVDVATGTIAQQRPLLDAALRAAQARATDAGAKAVLDTLVAWDGNYDREDAAGTVDPGVATWRAYLDEAARTKLPAAARDWLGGPGRSHALDAGGSQGAALLAMDADDHVAVARAVFARMQSQFGSPDPASWRQPRLLYEVSALGLADPPRLKFYDRGTWSQAVELGP